MPSVYGKMGEACLNCPHAVLSSVSFQPFVITSLKRAIPTQYIIMRSDIKNAKVSAFQDSSQRLLSLQILVIRALITS